MSRVCRIVLARRRIAKAADDPADTGGVIPLRGGLQAHLLTQGSVRYNVFGTRSDGIHDDGPAIKRAHAFANRHKLPVINYSGEFWLKDTHNIDIRTSVDWGSSIFHLDEAYNRKDHPRFNVYGHATPIRLEQSRLQQVLPRLKKGQYMIPELREYANHLAFVRDENCRVGWRNGDIGKSWAMEDFFYIEEHGRIVGEVTWDFSDITHLELVPCDPDYLVVQGGCFYLSGNNSGDRGDYKWCGFRVWRSRTTIRNQFVGLEPGSADTSTDPRRGFYAFHRCFDVGLENIRMIPFEKRRGGGADLPRGTYGIYGDRVLNLLLRNVTAEGSYTHWGVIGTNLIKHFRVERCRLNRIDVHFHCYHLYVRDCEIGLNGITVSGGGDLFVENTRMLGSTCVRFRKDYGSRWDGDIRIRNCRLTVAATEHGKAVLSFEHENKDYGYELVYGRTIKVDDVILDYSWDTSGDCDMPTMRHPAVYAAGERSVRLPESSLFQDIRMIGRKAP